MKFGKDMNDDDLFENLKADIDVLRQMSLKYIKSFPAMAMILSTISYIVARGQVDMLSSMGELCQSFLPEIKKAIRKKKEYEIDNVIDNLDIDRDYFTKEN